MKIKSLLDKDQEQDIKNIGDYIWECAETRFEENKSSSKIMDYLAKNNFKIHKSTTIPNAFYATYGTGKPVIGLLAEYDALSQMSQRQDSFIKEANDKVINNNGHGCGHHLLGAGAVGASIVVKSYLDKNNMQGTVVLFGCPGEEGGSGKAFMAKEGMFNDIDIALTWHPGNYNAVMRVNTLANYQVYFRFKGKSAHAAACPHLGRSALDAVELMNVGVNYLREHIIPEARVHYAITDSGGISPNVVQPKAEVLYLIRALNIEDVDHIYKRVCKIAQGAALMTETSVEIIFDKGCSSYTPNKILDELMLENMKSIELPEYSEEEIEYLKNMYSTLSDIEINSDIMQLNMYSSDKYQNTLTQLEECPIFTKVFDFPSTVKTLPGSTDVGDVSKIVPVSQILTACFAVGTPAHSWQLVSQGKSSIAHKGMIYAANVLAKTAINLIENVDIIEKAKDEHRKNCKAYMSPIPDGVMPSLVRV